MTKAASAYSAPLSALGPFPCGLGTRSFQGQTILREMIASAGDKATTKNNSGLSASQLIQSTRCLSRLRRCIAVTPVLRVLSNPLDRIMFRYEALDDFCFAIGPQNIDPPARPGIFPRHKSWLLLGHPSIMRRWRPDSSQLSCHNQTDPRPDDQFGGVHSICASEADLISVCGAARTSR
jgi:hypothetical protein